MLSLCLLCAVIRRIMLMAPEFFYFFFILERIIGGNAAFIKYIIGEDAPKS